MTSLFPIFTANAGRGIIPSSAGSPVKGCLAPAHSSGLMLVVVVVSISATVGATVLTTVVGVTVVVVEEVVVLTATVFSVAPHADAATIIRVKQADVLKPFRKVEILTHPPKLEFALWSVDVFLRFPLLWDSLAKDAKLFLEHFQFLLPVR